MRVGGALVHARADARVGPARDDHGAPSRDGRRRSYSLLAGRPCRPLVDACASSRGFALQQRVRRTAGPATSCLSSCRRGTTRSASPSCLRLLRRRAGRRGSCAGSACPGAVDRRAGRGRPRGRRTRAARSCRSAAAACSRVVDAGELDDDLVGALLADLGLGRRRACRRGSRMIVTERSTSAPGRAFWFFGGTALRTTSRPPWRSRPCVGLLVDRRAGDGRAARRRRAPADDQAEQNRR